MILDWYAKDKKHTIFIPFDMDREEILEEVDYYGLPLDTVSSNANTDSNTNTNSNFNTNFNTNSNSTANSNTNSNTNSLSNSLSNAHSL